MDPTITCDYSQFQTMVDKIRTLETRNAEIERQLSLAPITSENESAVVARLCISGIRAALPIVQFSVANLDFRSIRGWPHAELAALARCVQEMPGVTAIELEWANRTVRDAAEMAKLDGWRRSGRQQELASLPLDAPIPEPPMAMESGLPGPGNGAGQAASEAGPEEMPPGLVDALQALSGGSKPASSS